MKEQLNALVVHTYVKCAQAKFLEEATANVDRKHIGLQVDFSENYAFKRQYAIRGPHWFLHMAFVTKKKTRILMTQIFKSTDRILDQSPKPIGFMPCFSIPLIRVVLLKNLTSLSTNSLYSA